MALATTAFAHEGADLPDPDFDWLSPAVHEQERDSLHRAAHHIKAFASRHSYLKPAARFAHTRLRGPQDDANKTCLVCQEVGQAALTILKNTTDRTIAISAIAAVCKDIFKQHELDDVVCNVLPDAVILVSELLRYRFNFDVPNIVCADMLHQCVENCCDPATPYLPQQIHLSFDGENDAVANSTNMRVAWTTLKQTTAGTTGVWWRDVTTSPPGMWSANTNTEWRTYTIGGWVGVLHSSVMTNLAPGRTYEYYVGDSSPNIANATSAGIKFKTLPLNAGTDERPLNVLALADMGFGPNAQPSIRRMTQMVEAGEVDFIVHAGDIGYADGNQMFWDRFMREMQPIMSRVAYMTGPGNHECFFWNCSAYRHRFWMPQPSSPSTGTPLPESGALFYRVYAGPIVFYMLDSESALNTPLVSDLQATWVRDATAQDAATGGRMLFATHHRPLYCDQESDSIMDLECGDYAKYLRSKLEQSYIDSGVAAVMVGHLHNYQRTWPVAHENVVAHNYDNASAPMYLVNGAPGNREGNPPFKPGNIPAWGVFRTIERSFMTYRIVKSANKVALDAKLIRSTTGAIIDRFNITKFV
eukprot:CAMPEP_0174827718 /NCGR_PEP_ID=MMETSP1114-20130205/891_1 /TAXON_ID=312471 /ORGANISM="Neobodo designis, Strain CCAP 1951/1" /LENGTH=585 /DNA_ID=CAMNT_0016061393 /DNA_START=59 /DNA_END=1816 /DNA_ORIENTATION=+